MADTETPASSLALAASFPPEERFAATAAEIAARLAASAGCGEAGSEEIRRAVDAAFHDALAAPESLGAVIDVSVQTTDGHFDAGVSCGGVSLLKCSRPRSA